MKQGSSKVFSLAHIAFHFSAQMHRATKQYSQLAICTVFVCYATGFIPALSYISRSGHLLNVHTQKHKIFPIGKSDIAEHARVVNLEIPTSITPVQTTPASGAV